MKYPIKKILILVTILAVPGFLYYLLQEKGKNRYKPLAIYGPKKVASTFHSVRGNKIPDTIYHSIPDFKLINQDAVQVNRQTYQGKILLVNLFYTGSNNYGILTANKAMAAFAKMYEKNKMLHFISITMDPVIDEPSKLVQYSKQFNSVKGKWDLLTGDTVTVNNLIRNGLLLDAVKTTVDNKPKFSFSNMFVLIDTKHRIRGYYEATNKEALSKLDDEIKVLIAEELRDIKDGR